MAAGCVCVPAGTTVPVLKPAAAQATSLRCVPGAGTVNYALRLRGGCSSWLKHSPASQPALLRASTDGAGESEQEHLLAVHGCAAALNLSLTAPAAAPLPLASEPPSPQTEQLVSTGTAPSLQAGPLWERLGTLNPQSAALLLAATLLLHGILHVALRRRPVMVHSPPDSPRSPERLASKSIIASSALRSRCTTVQYQPPQPSVLQAQTQPRETDSIQISLGMTTEADGATGQGAQAAAVAQPEPGKSRSPAPGHSRLRSSILTAGQDGAWTRKPGGGRLVRHQAGSSASQAPQTWHEEL